MPDTVILTPTHPSATMQLLDPTTGLGLNATVSVMSNPDGSNAFVVWLDTDTSAGNAVRWEPTADRLRVNVNDGPVWNYPDTPGRADPDRDTEALANSLRYIHAARQAAHAGGGCPPGPFPCAACPPVLSAAVALDILLADGNRPRACHPARLALHDAMCRSGCEGTGRDEHARRQESTVREFRRFIDLQPAVSGGRSRLTTTARRGTIEEPTTRREIR